MKKFLSRGFPYHRGRRTRISENIRELTSETSLNSKNLIMPYFVREESDDSNILSMKGIKRLSSKELLGRISKDIKNGINTFALFPKIPDSKKSSLADESLNEENLVCRIIKTVKKEFPNVLLICDVALDAYTVNGHDGVVNSDGDIDNDKTIDILKKMSINFASSGCDIVAPSDMMDGRVKIIREELESNNFYETSILSYSSKFCSNFYSPFRDALGSQNSLGKSDKKTYQIDFRNRREAIKESLEDVQEGADILMVKPAGYYLDIIREIKNITLVPISAFQVSGEYSMIKYASEQELIDYEKCVIESLFCIKRAGADLIFSYFSSEVAKWLKS